MAINNTDNYTAAMSTLKTSIDLTTPELSYRMKTSEFNAFFKDAEAAINVLYEKSRVLQDTTDFVKKRILEAGQSCSDEIGEIENNIDNTVNSYLNKSYVVNTLSLNKAKNSSALLTDRSDATLPAAIYKNGKIIMPSAILNKAAIKSIATEATRECFENNKDKMLSVPYRAVYKVNSENDLTGVQETFTVLFNREITANYIDLQRMNCYVESVYAINREGLLTQIDISNLYITGTKLTGLKIVLSCDKYSTEIQQNSTYNSSDFLKSTSQKADADTSSTENGKDSDKQIKDNNNLIHAKEVSSAINAYTMQAADISARNKNTGAISNVEHTDTLTADELSIASIISEENTTNYIYEFGIDSLTVEQREVKPAAGIAFTVDITNCTKVELECDTSIKSGCEFYIIDNNKTVSIINQSDNKQICDERIFYGKSLRFPYDAAKYTIKKNGTKMDSATDINDIVNLNDNEIYTVDYTANPIDLAGKNVTAVKAILRFDKNTQIVPPTISRMAIRKYGGEVDWIL